VHVGASTEDMKMVTPLRKGSVFEAGKVTLMWEGSLCEGKNWMEALVRCAEGSKDLNLLPLTVNSPARMKPEKASLMAVSRFAASIEVSGREAVTSLRRTSRVMGATAFLVIQWRQREDRRLCAAT